LEVGGYVSWRVESYIAGETGQGRYRNFRGKAYPNMKL
jgi:hypothetical protein